MRCPKCGKESPEQARFCRVCGERLADVSDDGHAPRVLSPEERSRRLLEDAFRMSEEGRVQSAVHACQQAIALNPTSTSAHSLLGTLYERTGDRGGAIREYEQVLTLSPGSTVERRRLNELMGVAAAPEQVAVSPRTARMAATGGFVVVALILVAALVFTGEQQERSQREQALARARQTRERPVDTAVASSQLVSPHLLGAARARSPRPVSASRGAASPAPARRAASQAYGQWIGPGTFLLSPGGREPYALAQGGYSRPPIRGALRVRGAGAPTVNTPSWRYPAGVASIPGAAAPRLARNYYYQGNYQASIESYRGYLAENPQAAAPRQELAWVYMESGDRGSARQQYERALDQYQADLRRGHNVEDARHGARTCESAINVLGTE